MPTTGGASLVCIMRTTAPNKLPFPPCGGRMRSLSEAEPSLGGAGWGVAHREVRALERAPIIRGAALHHPPSQPSPTRGEGAGHDAWSGDGALLRRPHCAGLVPFRRRGASSFALRVRVRARCWFRGLRHAALRALNDSGGVGDDVEIVGDGL